MHGILFEAVLTSPRVGDIIIIRRINAIIRQIILTNSLFQLDLPLFNDVVGSVQVTTIMRETVYGST